MNSTYQQGGFQNFNGQAQYNTQANRFQPTGFVQSQYQGGIKSQNAGPVISHIGYSAAQNQNLQNQGMQNQGMQNQSMGQYSNQGFAQASQFSNNNQYNQPVIAHAGGYTAGQQSYGRMGSQPTNAMQFTHSQQPVISHAGTSMGQNFQSNQSQYRQQPQQQFNQQQFGQNAGFGASSSQGFNQFANASTQQNPVYQATHASHQEGPVLSHLGYSAGSQAGMNSFGMNQR